MRNGNLIESNKLNNKNNKKRYENKKSKIFKKNERYNRKKNKESSFSQSGNETDVEKPR